MTSNAPSERQILYALVSGGFVIVVAVLVAAAALAGLVPIWWSIVSALATLGVSLFAMARWRNTRAVLVSSIVLFVAWVVGTLLLA